jgi:hypothetical protein
MLTGACAVNQPLQIQAIRLVRLSCRAANGAPCRRTDQDLARFRHWREEPAPGRPPPTDRAAPCEIAPSLDTRPRSGYALPASRTQRPLFHPDWRAVDYRTGEKAVGISSLFSCRTGRTPVCGGHAPPGFRDSSRTLARSLRSLSTQVWTNLLGGRLAGAVLVDMETVRSGRQPHRRGVNVRAPGSSVIVTAPNESPGPSVLPGESRRAARPRRRSPARETTRPKRLQRRVHSGQLSRQPRRRSRGRKNTPPGAGSLRIGLQPVRVGQAGGAPLLQVLRHQAGVDQLVAQIVGQGARIALIVHDVRRDQDEQLGAGARVVLVRE